MPCSHLGVKLCPARQHLSAAFVAIGVVLVATLPAMAQDGPIEPTPAIDSASVIAGAPMVVSAVSAESTTAAQAPRAEPSTGKRPAWFLPIHIFSVAVQGLDAHSTFQVLKNHSVDVRPVDRGMTSNTAALLAVKAGMAAAVVYATDKLSKHHRVGAVMAAVAVNSTYLTFAATNYQSARATESRFGR